MNPRLDILHRSFHVAHCIMPFAATVRFHILCSASHNPLVVFIEEVRLLKAFRDKEYAAQSHNNGESAFDYIQPALVRHKHRFKDEPTIASQDNPPPRPYTISRMQSVPQTHQQAQMQLGESISKRIK